MSWDKLQKPYTGLHWWYRLLTGRKYNYPVSNQHGQYIYWKRIPNGEYRPAHGLNILWLLKFSITHQAWWQYLSTQYGILSLPNRLYRYIIEKEDNHY